MRSSKQWRIIHKKNNSYFNKQQEEKKEEKATRENPYKESLKVEVEPIQSRRMQNRMARIEAEKREEEKNLKLLKAIASQVDAQKEDDEEIEAFFQEIKKKTDEYMKKQEEERRQNREEGKMTKSQAVKNTSKEKNKTTIKVSGTSFAEILSSDAFQGIWQDEEETR